MEQKNDIQSLSDIEDLVNHFYERVRTNVHLKDIFNDVIKDKWPEHLQKMYR